MRREGVFGRQQSPRGRRTKAPIEPLGRLLTHDSYPSGSRSEAGEARASWRLREGFTFGANARLTAGRFSITWANGSG